MRSLSSKVLSTSTRKTVVSGVIIRAPSEPVSVRLMCFVPQPDRRLCQIVLVAENAEARCAEQQVTPGRCLEAEPAGGEHSRDMGARKDRDIALDSAYALNNPVGPRGYLTRSFASRA